jgi:hypothetical protein
MRTSVPLAGTMLICNAKDFKVRNVKPVFKLSLVADLITSFSIETGCTFNWPGDKALRQLISGYPKGSS